ncbi:MAG: ABC transporter permease [Acidobacteriota bacterium]|jgi:hypothetical protein|nr:ABC transporter permease [Acidobacteriota bacterium]
MGVEVLGWRRWEARHARQTLAIMRIELRRAFFSRRAFWVYALALLPAVIVLGHGMGAKLRRIELASAGRITPAQRDGVKEGDAIEAVLARLGKTSHDRSYTVPAPPPVPQTPAGTAPAAPPSASSVAPPPPSMARAPAAVAPAAPGPTDVRPPPRSVRTLVYFDGERRVTLVFHDGVLASKAMGAALDDFEDDRRTFAGVFQFYYLRLAVFFGALGVFMNLFRGEMLDKTLHFWFLSPVRREVLLLGKYGAGLAASTVIFVAGALLAFAIMVWSHDPVQAQLYWREAGAAHAFWYALAATMGCVGYGSVFLAAGLFLRNPVVPAAALLAWEGVGSFLPAVLQKASILHYLQSLCPVPAAMDRDVAPLLRILMTPATPASRTGAVLGLCAITAVMLWLAGVAVRRMQIAYGAEP